MEQLAYLVVLGTAIWAGIDASNLGAKRGVLGGGFLDMGPVAWFFAVWLLWIIAFPCYLVARPRLVEARRATTTGYPAVQAWGHQPQVASPYGYGATPPHQAFAAPVSPWGHQPPPAQAVAGVPQDGSVVNRLARLEALRDRGTLTPAEFHTLKQQVLDEGRG